jgi:hypothetical protein
MDLSGPASLSTWPHMICEIFLHIPKVPTNTYWWIPNLLTHKRQTKKNKFYNKQQLHSLQVATTQSKLNPFNATFDRLQHVLKKRAADKHSTPSPSNAPRPTQWASVHTFCDPRPYGHNSHFILQKNLVPPLNYRIHYKPLVITVIYIQPPVVQPNALLHTCSKLRSYNNTNLARLPLLQSTPTTFITISSTRSYFTLSTLLLLGVNTYLKHV